MYLVTGNFAHILNQEPDQTVNPHIHSENAQALNGLVVQCADGEEGSNQGGDQQGDAGSDHQNQRGGTHEEEGLSGPCGK